MRAARFWEVGNVMLRKPSPVVSAEPFWFLRNGLMRHYSTLRSDLTCDAVVVGGGITGALVLHELVRAGVDAVLLECHDIGRASTSASTALLQYELDVPLTQLRERLGARADCIYWACADAVAKLRDIGRGQLAIKDSLYLASTADDVAQLAAEFEARQAIGLAVEWLEATDLAQHCGIERPAAIRSKGAASVDPYAFTHSLLDRAIEHGARIFDRTAVTEIASRPDDVDVRTEHGTTIKARFVVRTMGYAMARTTPECRADLVSSFAYVTKPQPARPLNGYLVWETARPYVYLRATDDGRWIVGGGDVPFKNERLRDDMLPEKIEDLRRRAETLIDGWSLEPHYAWAGTFAETPDGLPYIGTTPHDPRTLTVCAFGGNGIPFAALAANIVRDHILGHESPLAALFAFDRDRSAKK